MMEKREAKQKEIDTLTHTHSHIHIKYSRTALMMKIEMLKRDSRADIKIEKFQPVPLLRESHREPFLECVECVYRCNI